MRIGIVTMKSKTIIKRSIDAAMYILLLLLMGQFVLPGAVHEWLGMIAGALFLLHSGLNYKWFLTVFKGKYTIVRAMQLVVDLLLLLVMLACMVSGILVSRHLFTVGSGSTIAFGRHLHLVATAWGFVLVAVHLGLHWSVFVGMVKKMAVRGKTLKVFRVMCRILVAALCVWGIYLFVERRFWEELFHLIDYQKEYDYSKSLFTYFAESAALSVPLIAAAYYAKKFLLNASRRRNGRNENNKN